MMGMTPAKTFAPPQSVGTTGFPNDALQQSQGAPTLPNNPFMPLIQSSVPTVQTSNAVPTAQTQGTGGGGNDQPIPYNPNRYANYPYQITPYQA